MCSKCITSEINIISKQLQQKTNSPVIDIVIKGKSGTGKRELLLAYLEKERQKFKHVIFINSESKLSVEYSFRKLHLQLNLSQYKIDSDLINTKSEVIVKDVYEYLNNGRILIVFSNLSSDVNIEKYLADKDLQNVFYIVTTNVQSVEGKQNILKQKYLTAKCIKNSLLEHLKNYNIEIIRKIDEIKFENYNIKQLTLKYYIGYININNIKLTESALQNGLSKCGNIGNIIDLLIVSIKKLNRNAYNLLLKLTLVGVNDIPLRLLEILCDRDVKSCIKCLVNYNILNKLLYNYYSIHKLFHRHVDLHEQKMTLLKDITRKMKTTMKIPDNYKELLENNVALHSMHVLNNIIKYKLNITPNVLELMRYTVIAFRKMRYFDVCVYIINFVENISKPCVHLTKIKLEHFVIRFLLIENNGENKHETISRIIEDMKSLPQHECKVKKNTLLALLYIEIEKYKKAKKILQSLDHKSSKNLLLHLYAKSETFNFNIVNELETTDCTPKLCKSKKYQSAVGKLRFRPDLDTHSIINCFNINKTHLGISHRKTVRSLTLWAKQKYRQTNFRLLFQLLEGELKSMQEHIGVHSILHPAYKIILETFRFYCEDAGKYDEIITLYERSIEVLVIELQTDGAYKVPSQHKQIEEWRAKISDLKTKKNLTDSHYVSSSIETDKLFKTISGTAAICISSSENIHVGNNYNLITHVESSEIVKKSKPLRIPSPEIQVLLNSTENVTTLHIKDLKLGKHWRRVMKNLYLSKTEIKTTKEEYFMRGGLNEVVYQLLRLWIEKNGSSATLQVLSKALWDQQQYEALDTLVEVFNINKPSPP